MKKRVIVLVAALSAFAMSFTACSEKTESTPVEVINEGAENLPADEPTAPNEKMGNMVMGKVTALDGNTVTVKTAQMPERAEGNPQDKPPMGENENGEKSDLDKPEPTDGNQPPNDRAEKPGLEMNFEGEEITITIDDESKLYKSGDTPEEKESCLLSDISVDSVLSIAYEDDGETIKEIIVRNNVNN